jgi:hypothetical protein
MRQIDFLVLEVLRELEAAIQQHAPIYSGHEAYSIILADLDGFWHQVKAGSQVANPGVMRRELLQVAAMAVRAVHDLGLAEDPGPWCPAPVPCAAGAAVPKS